MESHKWTEVVKANGYSVWTSSKFTIKEENGKVNIESLNGDFSVSVKLENLVFTCFGGPNRFLFVGDGFRWDVELLDPIMGSAFREEKGGAVE